MTLPATPQAAALTVWRIGKRKHKASFWAGDGARLYGGRWNSPGRPVVYTSATPALAQLEMLAHLENEEIQKHYVLAAAELPADLVLAIEDFARLPRQWRAPEAPRSLQRLGDLWLAEGRHAVLSVPSALSPLDRNYLINPLHPDFPRIRRRAAAGFRFDPRLG